MLNKYLLIVTAAPLTTIYKATAPAGAASMEPVWQVSRTVIDETDPAAVDITKTYATTKFNTLADVTALVYA